MPAMTAQPGSPEFHWLAALGREMPLQGLACGVPTRSPPYPCGYVDRQRVSRAATSKPPALTELNCRVLTGTCELTQLTD